jgi:hypothetical protein
VLGERVPFKDPFNVVAERVILEVAPNTNRTSAVNIFRGMYHGGAMKVSLTWTSM